MAQWSMDTEEFKAGAHPYLDQYLKVASHGNVTAEFAIYICRMRLACKVCLMQLTVAEPSGSELDYGVQEFVKLHAHTGGHKDKVQSVQTVTEMGTLKEIGDPAPNPDQGKIEAKLIEYAAEMEKKAKDEALAKKIKQLQAQSEQDIKVQELAVAGWGSFKTKGLTTQEEFESHKQVLLQMKEKQQMLTNMLLIMDAKEKNAALEGAISGHHVTPEKKREKPLKLPTGRKFR